MYRIYYFYFYINCDIINQGMGKYVGEEEGLGLEGKGIFWVGVGLDYLKI